MKKNSLAISLLIVLTFAVNVFAAQPDNHPADFSIDAPAIGLREVPFTLTITALDSTGSITSDFQDKINVNGICHQDSGKLDSTSHFENGKLTLSNIYVKNTGTQKISFNYKNTFKEVEIRIIPGFLSLLPPIIEIGRASCRERVCHRV